MNLNVFASNPRFSMTSLTAYVVKRRFIPGQVGRLGIFNSRGIRTTTAEIEIYQNKIFLIETSPRGGNAVQRKRTGSTVVYFKSRQKKVEDFIGADEIQNVRGLGTENELETVEGEVNRRQDDMMKSLDTTMEYLRLGALQGIIRDADGSTAEENLFTKFGISQTTVDMDYGTTTIQMLSKAYAIRTAIEDALGADGSPEELQVGCFLGSTAWDRFINHPSVKDAYKYYEKSIREQTPMLAAMRSLRRDGVDPLTDYMPYSGFFFGGIYWWKYRGTAPGTAGTNVPFVAASEGHAFPMNVPDLFIERFAPAPYESTVNTEGLPAYSRQIKDPEDTGRKLIVESHPIQLCTRPESLIKLTTTS